MNNTVNNDIETSEEAKRPKLGARPIFYSAASILNGELIHELFHSPTDHPQTKEEVLSFSKENVEILFKQKHGSKPTSVQGPFYEVKLINVGENKEREAKVVPFDQVRLTSECREATFRGWKGLAYGMKDNSNMVYFISVSEIDGDGKKRTPPASRAVLSNSVKFTNNSNTL